MLQRFVSHGGALAVALIAALFGCGDAPIMDANPALGIARFVVEESTDTSRVRGLDAAGNEVGRLELVHGRFTLTGIFRDDYDTPEVVGRQLRVAIAGQSLAWETMGFEPTLHMPAHPASHATLAAFLADPRVASVLARWKIGFESRVDAADAYVGGVGIVRGALAPTSYVAGIEPGTFVERCDRPGQTACDTPVRPGVFANTCGANAPALASIRVRSFPPFETDDVITQCCPATPTQDTPWFAIKTCARVGNTSRCGTSAGACKGCPDYPQDASSFCHVQFRCDEGSCLPPAGPGHVAFCYGADGAPPATRLAQTNVPQLWPSDQASVRFDLASCLDEVADPCITDLTADEIVSHPDFEIAYIGSDEGGAVDHKGRSQDDIVVIDPRTVALRRTRSGKGSGRVYHVGVTYRNAVGVSSSLDCKVGVPHDRGGAAIAIDDWIAPAGSPLNPGFVVFDP